VKRDLDNFVAEDWEQRVRAYSEEVDYGDGTATAHKLPDTHTVRVEEDREIAGERLHIFESRGSESSWRLCDATVFGDGLIYRGEMYSLFEFAQRIRDREIRAVPPEGAGVSFYTEAATRVAMRVVHPSTVDPGPEDLIADVCDRIDKLNDRPDSSDRCIEAAVRRARDPSEENRRKLEEAYEAVPKHRRQFILGDMDDKAYPIHALMAETGTEEFKYGRAYILDRFDDEP